MSKKIKRLLIGLASITALLIFIIGILPLIVRSQAVTAIKKETGRAVRIDKVSINPFTLSVTVNGFAIDAQEGGPFVSIGRLRASLSTASLYKMAVVLDEVTVDSPTVRFARLAANTYSFNDIIELKKAKPKKESQRELRFSVNNITLNSGTIDFDDQAVDGGRKHTIRNLKVAVPFISNIPYLMEKYTDPHISALVNDAPFSFSGKVKPLSKSMETSVNIDLKQFSLPQLVAYVPVKPPVDLVSGALSINSEVTYRVSMDKKPEVDIKGVLGLNNIAVNLRDGRPLVKLPSLRITASDLEFFNKRFLLDSVSLEGLELFVSRNTKSDWMFSQLLPAPAKDAKKEKSEPDSKPGQDTNTLTPLIRVTTLTLSNSAVHFKDLLPKGGFASEASQIDLTVKNFTTAPDKTADYELSLLLDNEATLNVDGTFSLTPLTATVSSELSDLKLQRGWPYQAQYLTAPVKGTLDLSSEVTYSKDKGVTVDQGQVAIRGFSTRYGDKEGFDLALFEVKNAGFKQKENSAEIEEVKLSKGNLSFSREADGKISVLSLLKTSPDTAAPSAPQAKAPASAKRAQKQPAARPFSYRLKKLTVEKFNTAVTDKTLHDKPRFSLNNTSLSLTNLSGPKFTPASLRFAATFHKATPLTASGSITPLPFHYKGSVSVGRLPLRDFEAYYPSNLNVFILGGFADTTMNVDIALKDGKPTGGFKGSAGIRSVHAIDTLAEEDLLKWESLQLDDIQGNLEPFSLSLREIAVHGVYSRIIIRKDGTLNLQNLVKKDEKAPDAQPAAATASKPGQPPAPPAPSGTPGTPAPQQAAGTKKQISIGALTIQDST